MDPEEICSYCKARVVWDQLVLGWRSSDGELFCDYTGEQAHLVSQKKFDSDYEGELVDSMWEIQDAKD